MRCGGGASRRPGESARRAPAGGPGVSRPRASPPDRGSAARCGRTGPGFAKLPGASRIQSTPIAPRRAARATFSSRCIALARGGVAALISAMPPCNASPAWARSSSVAEPRSTRSPSIRAAGEPGRLKTGIASSLPRTRSDGSAPRVQPDTANGSSWTAARPERRKVSAADRRPCAHPPCRRAGRGRCRRGAPAAPSRHRRARDRRRAPRRRPAVCASTSMALPPFVAAPHARRGGPSSSNRRKSRSQCNSGAPP